MRFRITGHRDGKGQKDLAARVESLAAVGEKFPAEPLHRRREVCDAEGRLGLVWDGTHKEHVPAAPTPAQKLERFLYLVVDCQLVLSKHGFGMCACSKCRRDAYRDEFRFGGGHIVIEKAGINFRAYVPALPGCVSTGATIDETIQHIREAIRFHIFQDGGAE